MGGELNVEILEDDNLTGYYDTQSMHSHLEDLTEVVNTSFLVFKEAKTEWLSVKGKADSADQINSSRKYMDIWAKNFVKSCALKSFVIRDIKESERQEKRIKYLGSGS